MSFVINDEKYAELVAAGEETINDGRIVTTRIQFRVALMNAYRLGWTDREAMPHPDEDGHWDVEDIRVLLHERDTLKRGV